MMLNVENNGQGNCMYYAYSISLMFFLRSKNDKKITENIFQKLELQEEEKNKLRSLLNTDKNASFKKEDIEHIIEPILGRATRALAAKHTREEFLNKPESSNLFASTQYGLEIFFKKLLQQNHQALAKLISDEAHNSNFTEAEIYRTPGIINALEHFANTHLDALLQAFEREWNKKEKEISTNKTPSPEDIAFSKKIMLDGLISKNVIEFFTAEDCVHLDAYINRLNQEFVWGTEDTLMTLHRAIRGDQLVLIDEKFTENCDNDITLQLYINDRPLIQNAIPDIIVNNLGNYHWNSIIPEHIFTPEKDHETANNQQIIIDDEVTGRILEKKKTQLEKTSNIHVSKSNPPIKNNSKEKKIQAPGQHNVKATKNKINEALNELDRNIKQIDSSRYQKSHEKAQELLLRLIEAKQEYFTELNSIHGNIQQASQVFKKNCTSAINDAKQVLEHDLGWGNYLQNLLKTLVNAIISTVTLGQVNSFFSLTPYPLEKTIEKIEGGLELKN